MAQTRSGSNHQVGRNPSLDIKPQTSTWTKKHKRVFHAALSGLKRCEYLKRSAYFLTLTSAPGSHDLARHWDLLVKRVRRELNYSFQYMKVETSEGNGVIHALFHSAFDGWRYDEIHAYFSCLWQELHDSRIVWCSPVMNSKGVAGYMTQYLANQHGFLRRSCSLGWLFAGYRRIFINLVKTHGLKNGLRHWDVYLRHFSVQRTLKASAPLLGFV